MARSRNIKPAFFKNELLAEVEPEGRLLFIGLWTLADRNGLIEFRPKRIKAEIFPYEYELDINRYITVLSRLGFIHVLTDGKTDWLYIVNFNKHQNPHHTEKTQNPEPKLLKEKDSSDLTVKEPLDNGDNPADSLTLIPDSPLPNTDSGTQDGDKSPRKTYKDLDYSSWPSMPKPEVLADWMEVRRKKKAANTQTAINGIGKQLHEAAKSGFTVDQCIEEAVTRSWSGFKAEWMCRQSGGRQNEEGRRIDNSAPGRVRAANRRRQIERGEVPDDFSY